MSSATYVFFQFAKFSVLEILSIRQFPPCFWNCLLKILGNYFKLWLPLTFWNLFNILHDNYKALRGNYPWKFLFKIIFLQWKEFFFQSYLHSSFFILILQKNNFDVNDKKSHIVTKLVKLDSKQTQTLRWEVFYLFKIPGRISLYCFFWWFCPRST